MSSVVLSGDTSGSVSVTVPAVAGTNTVTIPAVTGTAVIAGQNSAITAGTNVTPTTTTVSFAIPSWVKRITIMLAGVSTSGTSSAVICRIGTGGALDSTSTYLGVWSNSAGTVGALAAAFVVAVPDAASNQLYTTAVLTNVAGNVWSYAGTGSRLGTANVTFTCSGSKSLSGVLDIVGITIANGTDTLDAGNINILYE